MFFAENKLLIGVTLAGAIVVGAILSLALSSWIFLVFALIVHVIATSIVVAMTMRMADERDKPDPRTVARLEEEGVPDPEREVNRAGRSARRHG